MRFAAVVAALTGLVCVGAALPAAAQPSFDCAKAGAAVEKAICSDEGLGRLDSSMAEHYRARMKALGPGPAADALRNDQRAWIARRDKLCPVSAAEARAPSDKTLSCLYDSYGDRTQQIHEAAIAQAVAAPAGAWTGTRKLRAMGLDGQLTLSNAPGGALKAEISTVAVIRQHMCEIELTGKPQGDQLRWTDTELNSDGKRCRVTLRKVGTAIKVEAEDCRDSCGVAAGFEGVYTP